MQNNGAKKQFRERFNHLNYRKGNYLLDLTFPVIAIGLVALKSYTEQFPQLFSNFFAKQALMIGFSLGSNINFALELADDNLPPLFQNIGLALLSILIPLALAIFTDAYQKKGNKDTNFCDLDLHVILDRVFRVKYLILCSLLVFLPFILWEIILGWLRFTVLLLSSIGLFLIITIILNIYWWTKGNILEFRYSYLRKLTRQSDIVIAWRSVWNAKKISVQEERDLWIIYSANIDKIVSAFEN